MRFFVTVLTCLIALAVETPVGAEAGASCRIVFLNRPASAPHTMHLFDGKSSQEVGLPSMNLSPVYQVRPGTITLSLLSDPVNDPVEVPEDAPSVEVPEGVKNFYLLITAEESDLDAPLSIQLIDASDEKFKPGQMMWVNLTTNVIQGQVGDQELELPSEAVQVIDAPLSTDGAYPIQLDYKTELDDTVRPIFSTQWQHDSRSRSVVFVYNEINRRHPRVSGFNDRR